MAEDTASSDDTRDSIVAFLGTVRPLDELPLVERVAMAERLIPEAAAPGKVIVDIGERNEQLYLLRRGAIDIHDATGGLYARRYEGESFGFVSLVKNKPASYRITAVEHSLFYALPSSEFYRLCQSYDIFHDYHLLAEAQRLHLALERARQTAVTSGEQTATLLSESYSRVPLIARADLSIAEAARLMNAHDETCLVFVDPANALIGIVTDRDFRKRAIARDISPDEPIERIISATPVCIDAEQSVFDASMQMMRHNVHHLPIVHRGRPTGLVTSADIWQRLQNNPLQTSAEVFRANSVERLAAIAATLPSLLSQLTDSGLEAHQVAHYLSSIGENITTRLLQLAEELLGAPPIDYAWLAAGSLGRREQLLQSDQDNALVLADEYDEAIHAPYFESLSRFVCESLERCGYAYCPGHIMACNSRWRQPLHQWKAYFRQWIAHPQSEELMYCSIFFDLRTQYGNAALLTELQQDYAPVAKGSPVFLAHLFLNTLQHTPPLGFFRRLVLLEDDEHRNRLNIKNRGTGPVVDLARSLAVAVGSSANHTRNRLTQAASYGHLNSDEAGSLKDAYELIGRVRLRHQAARIRKGRMPDNFIDPEDLTSFERDHLRDAFRVVSRNQNKLVKQYRLYLPR